MRNNLHTAQCSAWCLLTVEYILNLIFCIEKYFKNIFIPCTAHILICTHKMTCFDKHLQQTLIYSNLSLLWYNLFVLKVPYNQPVVYHTYWMLMYNLNIHELNVSVFYPIYLFNFYIVWSIILLSNRCEIHKRCFHITDSWLR